MRLKLERHCHGLVAMGECLVDVARQETRRGQVEQRGGCPECVTGRTILGQRLLDIAMSGAELAGCGMEASEIGKRRRQSVIPERPEDHRAFVESHSSLLRVACEVGEDPQIVKCKSGLGVVSLLPR